MSLVAILHWAQSPVTGLLVLNFSIWLVVAESEEVLGFIERHGLHGKGIGYVDVHLLASVALTQDARLWTRAKRLAVAADDLGCSYDGSLHLDLANPDPSQPLYLNLMTGLTGGLGYHNVQLAIERYPAEVPSLEIPILVMHGTADRITPIAGSEMVRERAGSEDVTFTRYDGLYHEILNEPEREHVLNEIADWVEARLPARAR